MVKIDRSFVISMSVDEGDHAIVRSTIELARNLGHRWWPRGWRTRSRGTQLKDLGCDWAQGFYLARPWPRPDLRRVAASSAGGGTCRCPGRVRQT